MQSEIDFSDMADPAFAAKVAEYIVRDDASFAAWLAEDNFEALLGRAVEKAKDAFLVAYDLPEERNPRWTLAVIDLGHRRAKPLVQALAGKGLGQVEILSYTWEIGFSHIMGRRKKAATSAQVHATIDAFALALSKPGFELQIWRE